MIALKRRRWVTVLLLFGTGLGGCESGMEPGPSDPNIPGIPAPNPDPKPNPQPQPEPEPEPEPTIFGTWKVESGNLMEILSGGTAELKGLVLNTDKTGTLFLHEPNTKFVDCAPVSILFNGESLFVDFTPSGIAVPVEFSQIVLEGDELYIAGEYGPITAFSRVDELPADLTCRDSEVIRRFDELPRPGLTDLAHLDGGLYYTTAQNELTRRIDTATGEVGEYNVLHYPSEVMSAQPDGLWVAYAGNEDCRLSSLPGTSDLDTLNTNFDLLHRITIEQMAYDPATEQLWLHGKYGIEERDLLRANAKNEPDVLLDVISFDARLDAMACYGGSLWAVAPIFTQSIIRINPDTGEVVSSYEVPDQSVLWHGITFDNAGRLYLLGETKDGKGVIVETALK